MPDSLTRLQRIMRLAYGMQPEDEDRLYRDILNQRTRAYMNALEEEASKVGVRRRANPPRGRYLDDLRRMSQDDARSIARTYNRDLETQIKKLYDANPRGNRNYYISNLERWHSERAAWKNRQIALQNNKTARYVAQQAFKDENRIGNPRYRFTGPAPVCDDCADEFAAGLVDQRHVDMNPTPLHPNCPHEWTIAEMGRLGVPRSELWVG